MSKRITQAFILSRVPFKDRSGLSGESNSVDVTYTELNGSDRALYELLSNTITFTVLSNYTPIAYYVNGEGWIVSDAYYSLAVSKHQDLVRSVLKNEPNVAWHSA